MKEDYIAEQVIMQLRKVVDSIDSPVSLNWITTDKGGKVWVGHKNAKKIVSLFNISTPSADYLQLKAKEKLTEQLQTADGLRSLMAFVKNLEI